MGKNLDGKVSEEVLGRAARLTLKKMRAISSQSDHPYAKIEAAIAKVRHEVFGTPFTRLPQGKGGSRQARSNKGKRLVLSANKQIPKSLRDIWKPCKKHVIEYAARWLNMRVAADPSKTIIKKKSKKTISYDMLQQDLADPATVDISPTVGNFG